MSFEVWCAVLGALSLGVALFGAFVQRLPFSTAMVYLTVGWFLGSSWLGLGGLHPVENALFLERLTEFAVVVSLFASGLKLRAPLRNRLWRPALILASVTMLLTVGIVTLMGMHILGLGLGAAILLEAILAPTDPVLASDVQVDGTDDESTLRWALTGESSLNDGSAFPFVMLGLGLMGFHELGPGGLRWVGIDLVWATVSGLGIGWIFGAVIARLTDFIRRRHQGAVHYEIFISLGLIAASYGVSLLVKGYGFLAVFAAGLALRHYEMQVIGVKNDPVQVMSDAEPTTDEELAVHKDTATAHMVTTVTHLTDGLERIGELAAVLVVGLMLSTVSLGWPEVLFGVLLFLVARPLAVWMSLWGRGIKNRHRWYASWFGIRGIGSLYYMSYAFTHGVDGDKTLAMRIASVVLGVVAASTFLHGITSTPLMNHYRAERKRKLAERQSRAGLTPT